MIRKKRINETVYPDYQISPHQIEPFHLFTSSKNRSIPLEDSLNKDSLTASVKLPLINFNEPQVETKKMEKVWNEKYLFFPFFVLIAFTE